MAGDDDRSQGTRSPEADKLRELEEEEEFLREQLRQSDVLGEVEDEEEFPVEEEMAEADKLRDEAQNLRTGQIMEPETMEIEAIEIEDPDYESSPELQRADESDDDDLAEPTPKRACLPAASTSTRESRSCEGSAVPVDGPPAGSVPRSRGLLQTPAKGPTSDRRRVSSPMKALFPNRIGSSEGGGNQNEAGGFRSSPVPDDEFAAKGQQASEQPPLQLRAGAQERVSEARRAPAPKRQIEPPSPLLAPSRPPVSQSEMPSSSQLAIVNQSRISSRPVSSPMKPSVNQAQPSIVNQSENLPLAASAASLRRRHVSPSGKPSPSYQPILPPISHLHQPSHDVEGSSVMVSVARPIFQILVFCLLLPYSAVILAR